VIPELHKIAYNLSFGNPIFGKILGKARQSGAALKVPSQLLLSRARLIGRVHV
jgi:hypothetical protein